MTKSIFVSKTFWTQAVAFAAAFFPGVQQFLAENPVGAVAVLTSINVIVRFATKGRVNIMRDA